MKYRIYKIKTKSDIYYIVKEYRWFFYRTPLSNNLAEWYYGYGFPKSFQTMEDARNAIEKAIAHDNIPIYTKVVLEIDTDRDYPNI